jgi:hypothetical protein
MKKIPSKDISYFGNNIMHGYYQKALEKLENWSRNNYDLNIQYKKNNTLFFYIMQFNSWHYSHHDNEVFKNILDFIYDKVDINVKNIYQVSYSDTSPQTTFEASLCWKDKEMTLFKWITQHPKFEYNLNSNEIYRVFKKLNGEGYSHYYDEVVNFLLPFMKSVEINSAINAIITTRDSYISHLSVPKCEINFDEIKEKVDKLKYSSHFQINEKELDSHILSINIYFKSSRSSKETQIEAEKLIKYLEALSLESQIDDKVKVKPKKLKL